MKRSLKLILGLILAAVAFVGVILVGSLTQPPTYEVAIVVDTVAPFTAVTADKVQIDVQSLSAAVAEQYLLGEEWEALQAAGPVIAVEPLYPGQPLMREVLATGDNAQQVKRLSVALTNPDLTIIGVPVDPEQLPSVYAGDAVALYFSAGQLQAQTIATDVVTLPELTPDPRTGELVTGTAAVTPTTPVVTRNVVVEQTEPTTETIELNLPLTKRLAEGLVYRLNREQRENPNYGAPGMEHEPRTIEGQVTSLDVVVHQDAAEWIAFALAHGKVQVGVLPAVAIPQLQAGTLPPSPGATWTDLEAIFFAQRLGKE
jgi:hypothetical protein